MKTGFIRLKGDSWFFPRDWPRVEAVQLERDGKYTIVRAYATDQASGELLSQWSLGLHNRAERHVFFNVLRRDKDTSGALPEPILPAVCCISCEFRAQRAGQGDQKAALVLQGHN